MGDPVTGHILTTLTGRTHRVIAVAWSPDGTHLASSGEDGIIEVFRLGHGADSTFLHLAPVICMDWCSVGIAVGGTWGVAMLDLMLD